MRIAILTSITGLHQKLIQPSIVFNGVDYHAFVDNYTENETVWKQHKITHTSIDKEYTSRRTAKLPKILPQIYLPNYDYFLWQDSTHTVLVDPNYLIKYLMKDSEIGVFRHPQRKCAYKEAEELIRINYDSKHLINDTINFLRSENYPQDNGLYELSTFITKNSQTMFDANLLWWEIICKYSSRDQISLPYVLHKMKIKPYIFRGCANPEFCLNGIQGGNTFIPKIRKKF